MRTVGSARLASGQWLISAKPHAMIRLKRVFERINKAEHGVVLLSDTPQNARELLWFTELFPLKIEPLRYLKKRAAEYDARRSRIEETLAEGYIPPEVQLALPPRLYQRAGADLARKSGALLLADDLGLGKTVTAIAAFADPSLLPALVVTLTHLPLQWQAEINRFAPSLTTHILRTAKGDLAEELRIPRKKEQRPFPDVIITSYSKLSGWADVLAGKVKSVIFDEGQELRHPYSQKWSGARHIADGTTLKMILSATPVYNYGGEIHSLYSVIAPDALGTAGEFSREWCGGYIEKVSDPKALGLYLREQGLMLRRTRAEVGRELPPLNRIPHTIEADLNQIKAVAPRAEELARIILRQGERERGEKLRATQEIDILLRQATGLAKAPFVAAFVRMLVEQGEKVVLYGWHHAVYDVWREALADLKPAFFTGRESTTQKQEAKRRFVEGETPIIVLSNRAGAGLDGLQYVCRTVVRGELDWSPGVHDQGDGRVFRDGQKDPVTVYNLIADCGSDPVIADVLGLKRQQSEAIRDPNAELLEELTVDPDHIRRLAEAYLSMDPAQVTVPNQGAA